MQQKRFGAGTLVMLFFGAIFALCGTAVAVIGLGNYLNGRETDSWTATSGRVLSSSVSVIESTRSDGSTQTMHRPKVSYEYTVDGVQYEGDRVRAGGVGGEAERAKEIVDSYPQGTETTVYYDPDNPQDAVLIQGSESTLVYVIGGFGVVFAVVGLGLLGLTAVLFRRRKRSDL